MAVREVRNAESVWLEVTIDCADPVDLSAFWSALLDRPITDEHADKIYQTVGSRQDPGPRMTYG